MNYKNYINTLRDTNNSTLKQQIEENKITKREKELNKDTAISKELRLFQNEKKQHNYEKTKKSKTFKVAETYDIGNKEEIDILTRSYTEIAMKRPWNKLHVDMKINRLYNYIEKILCDKKYNDNDKEDLKIYLKQLVLDRVLTKKGYVIYNEDEITIENIPNLEVDKDEETKKIKINFDIKIKKTTEKKSNKSDKSDSENKTEDKKPRKKRTTKKKEIETKDIDEISQNSNSDSGQSEEIKKEEKPKKEKKKANKYVNKKTQLSVMYSNSQKYRKEIRERVQQNLKNKMNTLINKDRDTDTDTNVNTDTNTDTDTDGNPEINTNEKIETTSLNIEDNSSSSEVVEI